MSNDQWNNGQNNQWAPQQGDAWGQGQPQTSAGDWQGQSSANEWGQPQPQQGQPSANEWGQQAGAGGEWGQQQGQAAGSDWSQQAQQQTQASAGDWPQGQSANEWNQGQQQEQQGWAQPGQQQGGWDQGQQQGWDQSQQQGWDQNQAQHQQGWDQQQVQHQQWQGGAGYAQQGYAQQPASASANPLSFDFSRFSLPGTAKIIYIVGIAAIVAGWLFPFIALITGGEIETPFGPIGSDPTALQVIQSLIVGLLEAALAIFILRVILEGVIALIRIAEKKPEES